uniref:USP6 N-terminal-like protein n=1 Tax=Phallusia mammillata TaxID=59560 RepID=A0A6F9DWQ6_9ASCI|nr:USP6 N-terminal-like protein [Phallusia mammillata]
MSSQEEQHKSATNMPSLTEMSGEDYKKEALQRAAKERLDIVNRYKKGEDSEEEEDNWLDANARVYKVTDRYGFLHEKELTDVPSLMEERRKLTEVKRQLKWVKMLQKWGAFAGSEKLRERVYKGIPLNLRGDAWLLLLDVANLMKNEPLAYQEMKVRSHEHSPDIKQIDMDVNRTYRDHIMFRKRYSIKQQQLFDVLSAYSMYNTEVGYCQGMSQIAALLLMYMSEEEAFWALHSLLYGKKHLMHGFFIPGFPKLMRFQDHHDKILKKMMPRLKKHLDKNEIFASLYTMKWFFQCFLDRSPFPLTLRLWDIYVLEGEKLLTAMSYTTLKIHKAVIKKMDMEGIVQFLQEQLAIDFGADDDAVVEQLKANMNELRKSGMDLPPPPGQDEMPKLPFGKKIQPTFEQETGLRSPRLSVKLNQSSSVRKKLEQENKKKKKSGKKLKSPVEHPTTTNGAVTSGEASSASDARMTTSAEEPDAVLQQNEKKTSRKSNRRKSEESSKPEIDLKSKKKSNSKKVASSSHDTEKAAPQPQISSQDKNGNTKLSSDNGHVDKSPAKSLTKRKPAPANLVIPSTDNGSSVESHNSATREISPASSDSRSKLVWRTPSPNKISPAKNDFDHADTHTTAKPRRISKDSPVKWLPQDVAEDQSDSSTRKRTVNNSRFVKSKSTGGLKSNTKQMSSSKSQASARSFSEQQANEISPSTSEELLTNTVFTASMPHHHHHHYPKTGVFPLQMASSSRPFSVYDNVKAGLTESEDDLDDDVQRALVPSAGAERDEDSEFEAKMEESLENLRELTARLSRTPSPHSDAARPSHNNPRQASHRNPSLKPPLPQYKRSRSVEFLDEGTSAIPYSAALPTSNVTKSVSAMQLSKSVDHDYDHPRPSSTFQKAIADAGILTPLPKPPSSSNLNSTSFPRRTAVMTSKPETNHDKELWVSRKKSSWGETTLDKQQNTVLPTLANFVELRSSGRMESQPMPVDFGLRGHNGNNNSVVSTNRHPSHQQAVIRPSHSQYRRVDVPSQAPQTQRNPPTGNKYSRHVAGSMRVVRHDVDPISDQWIDVTGVSPNHSPQIPNLHQHPATNINRSVSAILPNRVEIRHRQAEVAPPPYLAHANRGRRYVIPDDVTHASSSSWSRTKRKNSSSIAVQTDGANDLSRSTMV